MEQWYKCPRCGKDILYGANPCPYCKCSLAWSRQGPVQYLPPATQPEPAYQPQQTPQYQQPEPQKKKSNKLGIIALAVVVVALAVVGSCVVCVMQPESSDVTSPSTMSEQAYALAIADQSSTLSKALTELSDLSQNYQFGDDEWTTDVALQMVKIRTVHDEAMAMTPPSSMAEIHYKYTQGLKHYYTMTDLLAEGIDKLDAGLIEQATTEMNIGTGYIIEATKLMNDFTESKSK